MPASEISCRSCSSFGSSSPTAIDVVDSFCMNWLVFGSSNEPHSQMREGRPGEKAPQEYSVVLGNYVHFEDAWRLRSTLS